MSRDQSNESNELDELSIRRSRLLGQINGMITPKGPGPGRTLVPTDNSFLDDVARTHDGLFRPGYLDRFGLPEGPCQN